MRLAGRLDALADRNDDADGIRTFTISADSGVGVKVDLRFYPSREQLAFGTRRSTFRLHRVTT